MKYCGECGQPNEADALYCGACGVALSADVPPNPESRSRLRKLRSRSPTFASPAHHSGLAVASLILAILALPGSLMALLGLVLAVIALIFGTMALGSEHRRVAITGCSLGCLAVLLSIGVWVYNYQHPGSGGSLVGSAKAQQAAQSSSVALPDISTPCFEAFTGTQLASNVLDTTAACTVSASTVSGGQYVFKAVQALGLEKSDALALRNSFKTDAKGVLASAGGGQIDVESIGTFGGEKSFQYEMTLTGGKRVLLVYVPHKGSSYTFVAMLLSGTYISERYQLLSRGWTWR